MCWEPDPIVVPAQLRVPFPALALLARSALPCGAVGSFSFPLVALFASLGFQWVSCRAEVCLPRAVSFRMSPWHMDVLLEGLTCPSRRGSRSMGWIWVHGSAPELGSPLEQWDCAVSPQGHLGWDSGVPMDSLAGRGIYPGKWEQKMLLGESGISSCFLLASLSPIHVIPQ